MTQLYKYVFSWLLLVCCLCPAVAQTTPDSLVVKELPDSTTHRSTLTQDQTLHFPNINRIPYFTDKKLLSKIKKYEQKKDVKNLMPALEKYVGQFGIENFYKNTRMLWQLAQLHERSGNLPHALKLYSLVLK